MALAVDPPAGRQEESVSVPEPSSISPTIRDALAAIHQHTLETRGDGLLSGAESKPWIRREDFINRP